MELTVKRKAHLDRLAALLKFKIIESYNTALFFEDKKSITVKLAPKIYDLMNSTLSGTLHHGNRGNSYSKIMEWLFEGRNFTKFNQTKNFKLKIDPKLIQIYFSIEGAFLVNKLKPKFELLQKAGFLDCSIYGSKSNVDQDVLNLVMVVELTSGENLIKAINKKIPTSREIKHLRFARTPKHIMRLNNDVSKLKGRSHSKKENENNLPIVPIIHDFPKHKDPVARLRQLISIGAGYSDLTIISNAIIIRDEMNQLLEQIKNTEEKEILELESKLKESRAKLSKIAK